jgi:protease I
VVRWSEVSAPTIHAAPKKPPAPKTSSPTGPVVIPGGRAPEYIRADPNVARIVRHFFDRGLPVGTICHGAQVPAALGLLRGRATAAFPPLKADMEQAGATFVDGPDVVHGAMVSCRGWPDLPEWSRAFMQVLERATIPA